jgi:hypothetical protein
MSLRTEIRGTRIIVLKTIIREISIRVIITSYFSGYGFHSSKDFIIIIIFFIIILVSEDDKIMKIND